jgi:hypothetical protein
VRAFAYIRRMASRGPQAALFSALQELGRVFGEDRVMNAAGSVLQTAAKTKATVDGNVATMLGLAGLPSRSDLDALRRQLDAMQATLANLSRKVDRLVEESGQHQSGVETHRTSPAKRRRRTTSPG